MTLSNLATAHRFHLPADHRSRTLCGLRVSTVDPLGDRRTAVYRPRPGPVDCRMCIGLAERRERLPKGG